MTSNWRTRITVDQKVLVGKPTVRGMRISVEHVLRSLASGVPEAELLFDYPHLELDDIRACLNCAAEAVAGERVNHRGASKSVRHFLGDRAVS